MPKVSIVMPACNVEKYIDECLQSVIGQTLSDIEIILIDDGSSDRTGEILDRYQAEDPRVRVLDKVNTGYGNSMNIGVSMATGEYIGIIETDDVAEPDMFEKLYELAVRNDADVVKSNYYRYLSREESNTLVPNMETVGIYGEVFSPEDHWEIFNVTPSIWSGIYRRSMIEAENIRFNETPGASYQDTSFAFKVWCSAKRVVLTEEPFLHYRIDNEKSSVNSPGKVFCICDEHQAMEDYLEQFPEKKARFEGVKDFLTYKAYRWNYGRLALEYKYAFLLEMEKECKKVDSTRGYDRKFFADNEWAELQELLADKEVFFRRTSAWLMGGLQSVHLLDQAYRAQKKELKELRKENKQLTKDGEKLEKRVQKLEKEIDGIRNSTSFRIGRTVTYLPRKIKGSGK